MDRRNEQDLDARSLAIEWPRNSRVAQRAFAGEAPSAAGINRQRSQDPWLMRTCGRPNGATEPFSEGRRMHDAVG